MACAQPPTSDDGDDQLSRLEDLKWELEPLVTVETVRITESEIDETHLSLELNTTMLEPDVEEVLNRFDAYTRRPSITKENTLYVEVILEENDEDDEEPFESAGENTIRQRGGSKMVALPPDAVELAGFDTDDAVEVDARENEVRLTRPSDE